MLNPNASILTHTKVRRRGTILVLTLTICFALAAVVLILARKMSVEAAAASNQVAAIQADAIERAGEQYVMAMLNTAIVNGGTGNANSIMDFDTYTEDLFAAIPVGADYDRPTGWFWIVRPQYDEDDLPIFGLVDECSKIDLNGFGYPNTANTPAETTPPPETAYYQGMQMLPGMTDDIAASIRDWMDPNTDSTMSMGMEDSYYLGLDPPYVAKNRRYSNVEELLLVYGITPAYVFGDGTAGPLGELPGTSMPGVNTADDPQLARGVYDLLTTHGIGLNQNFTVAGLINPATAPRPVLQSLLWSVGQEPSYADTIIAYRLQNSINPGTQTDTAWFNDALSSAGGSPAALTTRLTSTPLRYSADIVAVNANGRGYKRVRLVIDTAGADGVTTLVSAVSRRDLTDKGWPFDPAVLQYIRENRGQQLPVGFGVGGFVSSGIVTTSGGTQR